MEELLEGLLLALEELHVVDQQHVDVPVAALEGVAGVGVHGVDELVEEGLGGDVTHPVGRVVVVHVAGDGLEQVGLAQAGVAVDEQGVPAPGRHLGHGLGGGVGEAVGPTDHEVLEGVAGVELDVAGGWGRVAGAGRSTGPAGPGGRHRVGGEGVAGVGTVHSGGGSGGSMRRRSSTWGAPASARASRTEAEVAALDALLGQGAGDAEGEVVAVVVDGPHALEGGVPHGSDTWARRSAAHMDHKRCASLITSDHPPGSRRSSTTPSTLVDDRTSLTPGSRQVSGRPRRRSAAGVPGSGPRPGRVGVDAT